MRYACVSTGDHGRFKVGCKTLHRVIASQKHTGDDIRPGFRRLEDEKPVIFYRQYGEGIFGLRILHRGMLPGR